MDQYLLNIQVVLPYFLSVNVKELPLHALVHDLLQSGNFLGLQITFFHLKPLLPHID